MTAQLSTPNFPYTMELHDGRTLFEDAGFANVSVETIRRRISKRELFEHGVQARMPKAFVPKRRVRDTAGRNVH